MWQFLLGGAAGGAAKHFLEDRPAAEKARRAAAVQTRYSPWTGMGMGDLPTEPSLIGSMMSGASAMGGLGQSMERTSAYNKWLGSRTPSDVAPSVGGTPTAIDMQPERNPWELTPYRSKVGGYIPE